MTGTAQQDDQEMVEASLRGRAHQGFNRTHQTPSCPLIPSLNDLLHEALPECPSCK